MICRHCRRGLIIKSKSSLKLLLPRAVERHLERYGS
jgi:hypothetical protein